MPCSTWSCGRQRCPYARKMLLVCASLPGLDLGVSCFAPKLGKAAAGCQEWKFSQLQGERC